MYREVGVSYMASVGAAGVEKAPPPESPALDFIHLSGRNVIALSIDSQRASVNAVREVENEDE